MNNNKLKGIFTSKISIGVIGFFLGGILLGGTSSEVNITKERYEQLLGFEEELLNNYGKEDLKEEKEVLSEATLEKTKESEEGEVLSLGDKAYIENEEGLKVMSLSIDKVNFVEDRNEFSDIEAKKVVLIEYTYENIESNDNISLFSTNFKVYDEEGNILDTYPLPLDKNPKAISKGKKCTASMAYALNTEAKFLELEFYNNMFNSKPSKVFKLSL